MTTIVIDRLNEEDFRRSIETRLREGRAGAAIERLRALLAPYAGEGRILPERFLTIEASDLELIGWNALGEAVGRHDRPDHPVTGISVAFGWPGDDGPGPDPEGILQPHLEISYYTDEVFPFSRSGRDDLLEGYSFYGCTWSGDCVATDSALSVDGIDDLHGALAALENWLLSSEEPDEDGVRAGSLGACMLSALLVQAVTDRIARDGLPRPLCVMSGSSGVYPYFDTPVAGVSQAAQVAAEAQEELQDRNLAVPGPRYSSLLMTGIPRGRKRAVLVLDETEDEAADRIAGLRGLNQSDGEGGFAGQAPDAPVPLPELPEITPVEAGYSPLIAKKPHDHAWDFRDMLGPREPEAPVAEPPLPQPPEPAPAPAPVARKEPVVEPGFTLLEPELQQRLQSLISSYNPAVVEPRQTASASTVDAAAATGPDNSVPTVQERAEQDPGRGKVKPATAKVHKGLWSRLSIWVGKRSRRSRRN